MTVLTHLKGIFTTGEGEYINEHGERVTGKLPRTKVENPIKTMCRPSLMNYVYFFVGWMAWTMDGYDFHTVSLSVSLLAKYYHQERDHISTSITLTLLFRSVGAAIFGIAGDLYGRKWPMIINLTIIAALQLATAYCWTFSEFLGVRALFGIGMGGIWGLAASMGLENMPVEARGLFSGLLQQGYALGYLIAAVFNLTVVPSSPYSWRILFFIGAGLTMSVAIARLFFPESKQFIEQRRAGEVTGKKKVRAFWEDGKKIMKDYWKRALYAIVMMALFNCMSHTSQDMYPTYMQQTKGFSPKLASKATIIAKTGALVGGTICGYYSQFFGRRATIMVATVCGAALIPMWVLPSSWGTLTAGAFLLQFMVQGAWGVVPIHLQELSPPQFRSSFPGIAYQIGNMFAAPAAQISSVISERWIILGPNGEERPNYGSTQAVMMSVIFVLLCIWVACGDEQRGSHFELIKAAGSQGQTDCKERALEASGGGDEERKDGGEVEVRVENVETEKTKLGGL